MLIKLGWNVCAAIVGAILLFSGPAIGQDRSNKWTPVLYRGLGGDKDKEFSISEIAKAFKTLREESGINYLELRYADESKRSEILNTLSDNNTLSELIEALSVGGALSGVAEEILTMGAIADRKCLALGPDFEIDGNPNLVESHLVANYYARPVSDPSALGRGQFDVQTSKSFICRNNVTGDVFAQSVHVRWVFNVNGNGLVYELNKTVNGTTYPVMLAAGSHENGTTKIQVVLFEIDGAVMPPDHSVYHISTESCAEIFFSNPIPIPYGHVDPVSYPFSFTFCAGGRCRNDPPFLDATN